MTAVMLIQNKPDSISHHQWFQMTDVKRYLQKSSGEELAVSKFIHTPSGSFFLSSVLLSRRLINDANIKELKKWNFNPINGSWGYGYSMNKNRTKKYSLISPFGWESPEILRKAIPIITLRRNICKQENLSYYELNQRISQPHDLHWLDEQSAYCTIDEFGDIINVVSILMDKDNETEISFKTNLLNKHLLIGKYVLIRFFDVDRWTGSSPVIPHEEDYQDSREWKFENIYAKSIPIGKSPDKIVRAFVRGFQIIYPPTNRKHIKMVLGDAGKEYCDFITIDFKNKKIHEVSCNPKKLGNYFVESKYPFETSPVFFKKEVLQKYKGNPEKYTIEARQIHCREAWSLRYDINENGQVHTFLKDLSYLPYSEQLYFKSFNEKPKGGISKRSYKTDFLGEWDLEPEPLRDLKYLLEKFPLIIIDDREYELWKAPEGKDKNLLKKQYYLISDSLDEWEKEISDLHKLIIEGLELKTLRSFAINNDLKHEKLGSINLLELLLEYNNIADDLIQKIVSPLHELNALRSKIASHRKGKESDQLIQSIKTKYKKYELHLEDLISRLNESFQLLAKFIKKDSFNF